MDIQIHAYTYVHTRTHGHPHTHIVRIQTSTHARMRRYNENHINENGIEIEIYWELSSGKIEEKRGLVKQRKKASEEAMKTIYPDERYLARVKLVQSHGRSIHGGSRVDLRFGWDTDAAQMHECMDVWMYLMYGMDMMCGYTPHMHETYT